MNVGLRRIVATEEAHRNHACAHAPCARREFVFLSSSRNDSMVLCVHSRNTYPEPKSVCYRQVMTACHCTMTACLGIVTACLGIVTACLGIVTACLGIMTACLGIVTACLGIVTACLGIVTACLGIVTACLCTHTYMQHSSRAQQGCTCSVIRMAHFAFKCYESTKIASVPICSHKLVHVHTFI